jgi:hypothetical protein
MDSRSSTVNMDSGVVHFTIFGSLLFVKAYLFTFLLAGIFTRALRIGYVSSLRQVPWWDKFLRQNPIPPFQPKPTPTLFVILALNELQKQTESGNFISGRRDLPGQMMEAHKANPEIFREGTYLQLLLGDVSTFQYPRLE